MIYFICPDPAGFISGGNLFNLQILQGLATSGVRLTPLTIESFSSLNMLPGDHLILDSIYLDKIPSLGLNEVQCTKMILIHLLPSMVDHNKDPNIEKEVLNGFDCILANSPFTRDYLLDMQVPENRIQIIQPFIPIVPDGTPTQWNKTILVANWFPAKQIDLLIKQLVLHELPPDLMIRIYGDTEVDPSYFKFCQSIWEDFPRIKKHLSIERSVSPEKMHTIYKQTKCMVDLSSFETYGMAVAEAIVAGVSVLTLGKGHVKNLIGQGKCLGCSHPEELVNRLIQLHVGELDIPAYPIHDIITDWELFTRQLLPVLNRLK